LEELPTLGRATDDFDSVAADLHEQSAAVPLLVSPLGSGHFKNLEGVAGPPADKPAQLIDLVTPLGKLALRELNCHGIRGESIKRLYSVRATRVTFSG
jgi:hypothetical protein